MPEGMDIQDRRPTARLSEIDRRILRLVAQGRSSKEIAQELERSPLTIDSRLKDVCARLGADNRVHAATMLLMDETTDGPPDLWGPQSQTVVSGDRRLPALGEDGARFVPASASSRSGALGAGPGSGGDGKASQDGDRSLLRIIRTVMLILIGLACAAFFLTSAIEAGQEVFQSIRGVR